MAKGSDNPFPSILILEGTEPAAPSAGQQRVYIDSTTHKLKRTDSSGTDVTIESAGALVFLEAHSASASSSLDFTTFISSTYDTYKIIGINLVPATNAADLRLEIGTGGGPTYDTGNNYEWVGNGWRSDGVAHTNVGSTGIAKVFAAMSNTAAYGFGVFDLTLFDPQSTTLRKTIVGSSQYVTSAPANANAPLMIQWVTSATAVTALRFIMSSGNITSGTIRIYGVAKS